MAIDNRDFTLPLDEPQRSAEITRFNAYIYHAKSLVDNGDGSTGADREDFVHTVRDAFRMATELWLSGECDEKNWQDWSQAFKPYLPVRSDYVRDAELQRKLDERQPVG